MLAMIEELMRHKWWANARLLHSIEECPAAVADEDLRKMLQHILVANRFWLFSVLGRPFDREAEMQNPASFVAILDRFKETERLEFEWLSEAADSDLDRILETRSSRLGIDVSVRQAMLQICMHTQGHRAQCATRLRALGGTPAVMDYILWIKERPTTN